MAAASDSSDEDDVGCVRRTHPRESIRRQLATTLTTNGNESADLERRDSSGLLDICFMNEILSEGDSLGDPSGRQKLTLDELTARYIERNNISKKSNHVIVPLTPKSEERSFLDEPREAPELQPSSQSLSSDAEAFTAYLAQIQAEARQKLKAAKYEAARTAAEADGESSALSRDLKELIGERSAARISSSSSSSGPTNNRRRKLGRHALTELNLAQLQIILNYLLSRIEELNEKLVEDLIERDELLMEQDSLLTDIEDITKGIQLF